MKKTLRRFTLVFYEEDSILLEKCIDYHKQHQNKPEMVNIKELIMKGVLATESGYILETETKLVKASK